MLGVATRYPDFPIVLEAVRECLQDVYDLPALQDLLTRIARRQVRLAAVETPSASPFAAALLFDYVGSYMYADDVPVAERRAAALDSIDAMLAQALLLDAGRYATPYGFVRALKRRVLRVTAPAQKCVVCPGCAGMAAMFRLPMQRYTGTALPNVGNGPEPA